MIKPTVLSEFKQQRALLTQQLQQGLAALAQSVPNPDMLIDYLQLLVTWNQAYNLTAVRSVQDMITRHLLDSLAIRPYLQGDHILDVGTGAGLPGIPLALAEPQRQFALLDSNGKKIRFLTQVLHTLALPKVTLHCERVEKFQPAIRFDCITARAFTSLAELSDKTQHLLAPGGQLLAMKGQYPHEEIADLPKSVTVAAVIPLQIPELAASRHLVCLRSTTADGALTHG